MAVSYRENETVYQFTASDYNPLVAFVSAHARTWMSFILVLSDMGGLALSALLALTLRGLLGWPFQIINYARFAPLVLVFICIFTLRQLYPGIGLGAVEEMRWLMINTTLVFLAIGTFTFLDQTPQVYSRLIYLFTWLLALLILPLNRAAVRALFVRLKLWGEPVAVVGQPGESVEISTVLHKYPKIGLRPTLVCAHATCPAGVGRAALAQPDHGYMAACDNCPIRLARMALVVYSDYNELGAVQEKYRDTFERIILVNHQDLGLPLSGVSVREFGGLAGLEIRQNLLNRWAQMQKRIIDIVASGLALLALSPFFLILSALIYLDSPGRIFYRQLRVGKGGKHFTLLKFRTMHLNADRVLQSYLVQDPAMKAEWDKYQKLTNDPRITRVGKIIRRFSIDELSQLWNVFTGEMSLVGPRPIMINQVEMYGEPFEHYTRVTPGMTGLWQVSGRNKTTFARRAELDVQYVMNWSIWLDIYILIRTIWVVITRDGAA